MITKKSFPNLSQHGLELVHDAGKVLPLLYQVGLDLAAYDASRASKAFRMSDYTGSIFDPNATARLITEFKLNVLKNATQNAGRVRELIQLIVDTLSKYGWTYSEVSDVIVAGRNAGMIHATAEFLTELQDACMEPYKD